MSRGIRTEPERSISFFAAFAAQKTSVLQFYGCLPWVALDRPLSARIDPAIGTA